MSGNKIGLYPERLLGAYLFGLCLYQIGIYCWPGGPPFILDPRAGIPVLLINHFTFDNKIIYPVEWGTATWLVLMAAMIFFRGTFLKTYLISEIILAAPTAYYIGVLAIRRGGDFSAGNSRPSPYHAFVCDLFNRAGGAGGAARDVEKAIASMMGLEVPQCLRPEKPLLTGGFRLH